MFNTVYESIFPWKVAESHGKNLKGQDIFSELTAVNINKVLGRVFIKMGRADCKFSTDFKKVTSALYIQAIVQKKKKKKEFRTN